MLLHDARRDTRVDAAGDLVLLEEQDRSRWDHAQIAEGCERVERALRRGGPTVYALQAAIAALHAQAASASATDWPQIVLLYRELMKRAPSAVVALNHAAAIAMAEGAAAGLQRLNELSELEELQSYPPFFAARADLLRRLGRFEQAVPDYERGLALATNETEKRYLARRLDEMRGRIGNRRDT